MAGRNKNPFATIRRGTPKGAAGYDNPRENIDPHIRTQATSTRELYVSKHFELISTATVWDDQQVGLGTVGFGSSAPTWESFKGCEVLAFNKAQENSITFIMQLSHRYKIGSDVEFHLHTVPADDTAGGVKWTLTVSKADILTDFPAETPFSGVQSIDAGCADKHLYFDFDTIGTADNVSSFWLFSLTRNGTDVADDYDNDIYLIGLDAHFEIDTMGSATELTK